MTRSALRYLLPAAGLFAAAVLAGHAPSAQPPIPPDVPPARLAADPDDVGKAKKAPGRVLTTESLAEMLDNMGYEFRTDKSADGNTVYVVTMDTDPWRYTVYVSLSPSKSLVWLLSPLGTLPAAAPAERLFRLLQENWAVYPYTFAAVKDTRKLFLHRSLENQNMTPARLRAALDSMTDKIRLTAPAWDSSKWGQTPAPDGKAGPDGGTAAYPDTPEGLIRLCKDLLAAAKAGGRVEVSGKVKGLIVPGFDAWFKRVFGPDTGAALSAEYTAGLTQLQDGLTRAILTAAEEGQTGVKVFKFTRPDPDNATPNQNKALAAMVEKVPLYSAWLTQPGEETGMHLYSFVYVNGGFRLAGRMKAVAVRTSAYLGGNGAEPAPGAVAAAPRAVGQPPVNPVTPPFDAPPMVRGLAAEFRLPAGPAAPVTGENVLDPEAFRHLTPPVPFLAPTPLNGQAARADEPSVVGTWQGTLAIAGTRWKVAMTFRADGVYKTVMEYRDYIIAEKGTYTYADGILNTEPEGGRIGTYSVTFLDEATMKMKGGGHTITLTRQLAPLVPSRATGLAPGGTTPNGPGGGSWNTHVSDSAACPNRYCTGGWCYKAPGHGGPHQCRTCGWTWY